MTTPHQPQPHTDGQREILDAWAKQVTTEISDAIGLGSEMFVRHGEVFRIDPRFVAEYIRERRKDHHEAMHRYVRRIRDLEAQVTALSASPSTPTQSQIDGEIE